MIDDTIIEEGDMRDDGAKRKRSPPPSSLIESLGFSSGSESDDIILSPKVLKMSDLESPSPISSSMSFTPAKPPVFTGAPGENVANWIAAMDAAIAAADGAEDKKYLTVCNYLQGDAASIPTSYDLKNWADLKAFLQARDGSLSLSLSTLFGLRQVGSAASYLDRLLSVCTQIPDIKDQEKVRWFAAGLAPEFRAELFNGFDWKIGKPHDALLRVQTRFGDRAPDTLAAMPSSSSSHRPKPRSSDLDRIHHLERGCSS